MVKQKTYPSGLRLIVEENKSEYIAFGIGVNCGSINEKKDEYGLSHFLEHLFFKSTKSHTTSQLSNLLEFYGANINAFTSEEKTFYHFKAIKENFKKCFDLYNEMFFDGLFLKEEVDKEREVVIEEMKLYEDQSTSKLSDACDEVFNAKTPYGHKVIGEEQIIKNISIKKIKQYKNKHYTPNNLIISICGGIKFKEAQKLILTQFENHYQKTSTPTDAKEIKQKIEPAKKYVILNKEDSQVNIYAYIKAENKFSDKRFVESLYNLIMGSGLSSRMFVYLREQQGLAYSTRSYNVYDYMCGKLILYVGTRPENVKKCIQGFRFLLNEAAEKGFTQKELDKAKNLVKSNIIFNNQNENNIRNNFTNLLSYGKHYTPKQIINLYETVTLKDVNDFAKQIANEKIFAVGAIGKNIKLSDLKQFEK